MSTPNPSLERWQGRTDARVDDAERRLEAVNGDLARIWQSLGKLNATVAGLVVKVAVGAVIGGLLGSAVSMILVYTIIR